MKFRRAVPGPVLMAILTSSLFLAMSPSGASAADLRIQGRLSFWIGAHDRPVRELGLGLRYIPSLSLTKDLGRGLAVDVEASANIYGSALGSSPSDAETSGAAKAYRLWVRLSTARFEARLGLQKINFGSALLLRPLMWFDRLDPNDPLQLTDGVKGALLKYTFADNTNVWLWGLCGNDEVKGWETVPTRSREPEFGGRVQTPVLSGEAAFTYHHRRMDPRRSLVPLPANERSGASEDRIGLDGKWDVGPGVWFEAVLVRRDWSASPDRYQRMLTLGIDGTLGLGNGLHLLAEHLVFDAAREAFGPGTRRELTGLSADLPLGILDRVRAAVFRDWTSRDWYRILTWQRTTDAWALFVIAFWNPDRYAIYANRPETNLFSGQGLQITLAYDH
ncbi:MAG: hypothetical protein JW742_00545 [Candidatus Aminicenantes bacterium]|nr:hypothetical protein [Candidatus Aminicenantes bacterium]